MKIKDIGYWLIISIWLIFILYIVYRSHQDDKRCLEIYTPNEIYYVYPYLNKIEFETKNEVLYFNSFEAMNEWLSDTMRLKE